MVMEIDLHGRAALVTGAGRNIGRAIALNLAAAGASVAVTYQRDAEAAAATCAAVADLGVRAVAVAMELTESDSVIAGLERAQSALGDIDILVHNAAVRPSGEIGDIAIEEWDAVFGVNVRGPFILSKYLVPPMIVRGWGRVIALGGMHAYTGHRGRGHVLASKLAIVGLTRAIAYESAGTGVTANVVVPGIIDTRRGDPARYGQPPDRTEAARSVLVNRFGTPEEVADMCLFLASDRASYITGQEIFVSGGAFPMSPER